MEDHPAAYPGQGGAGTAARAVLGVLALAMIACSAFGAYVLGDSLGEWIRLDSLPGTSGSDYLGASIGGMLALVLLLPLVPSVLLSVLAMHPTGGTVAAGRVAVGLWWMAWLALFAASMTQMGTEPAVLFARGLAMLALSAGPATGTVCVHLIARGLQEGNRVSSEYPR